VSDDLIPHPSLRRDRARRNRPGRSPRPPKRREELLARAARAFRDKGFEATTTQDIADSLGILRGSLYYYIESKDDLLFEIVEDFHRRTLRIWELARAADGDTLVKLRAFLTAYVVLVIEHPVEAAVFFRDFRSLSPARQRRLVRERDQYWNVLRELVAEGQRDHVICPDVDIAVIQHGILGMVNFLSLYTPTAKVGVEELASHYTDFILAGLCCTPATHRPGHRAQTGALPAGFVDDLRREMSATPAQPPDVRRGAE
jgi:AcrR family transcriptional regulator